MSVQVLKRSATSQLITIWIGDSSSTTGAGLTGLAYNSAGLVWKYQESDQSSASTVTTATMTEGTWASGGFVESSLGKGWYQLGIPDAAITSGTEVNMILYGATNMCDTPLKIKLVATDDQDAAGGGMSNLNATVSSRASQTSLDTLDDYVDAEVAAIKAKTDNLPSDPADASDIAAAFNALDAKIDTIDDLLDTEIAAIKAQTDLIPADPADASDIASEFSTVNSTLATIAGYIDTEITDLQTQIGTAGAGLTAIPWNAAWDAEVQSEVNDALVAINLDYLFATDYNPSSPPGNSSSYLNEIVENDAGAIRFTAQVLELAPTGGGGGLDAAGVRAAIGMASANLDTQLAAIDDAIDTEIGTLQTTATNTYNIVNHATYGNAAIQTSIAALAPASNVASAFNQTYGSVISGTYSSTATDDNTRHVLAPHATNALDADYTFNIGTANKPALLAINGYFNGTAQYADVYAWDYEAAVPAYVQLSNSTTRMNTRSSDANYSYSLARQYVDSATGDVKIRFVSTSTNTAHRLHLDRLLVYSLTESGSIAGITAANVWEYGNRQLTSNGIDLILAADGVTLWKNACIHGAVVLMGVTAGAGTSSETFTKYGYVVTSTNNGVNRTATSVA